MNILRRFISIDLRMGSGIYGIGGRWHEHMHDLAFDRR